MKKWLYRIFWIPVLVLTVLFLVANRQPVAISFDPFSISNPAVATMPLPLWLWLILMLFMGVGVGALGMWLSGAEKRQKTRLEHRELKALRKRLAETEKHDLKEQSTDAETAPLLETGSS